MCCIPRNWEFNLCRCWKLESGTGNPVTGNSRRCCKPLRQAPTCVMGQSRGLSLSWSFYFQFLKEGDVSYFLEDPFAFFRVAALQLCSLSQRRAAFPIVGGTKGIGEGRDQQEGCSLIFHSFKLFLDEIRRQMWWPPVLPYGGKATPGDCGHDVSKGEGWCSGLCGPKLVFSDTAVMSQWPWLR